LAQGLGFVSGAPLGEQTLTTPSQESTWKRHGASGRGRVLKHRLMLEATAARDPGARSSAEARLYGAIAFFARAFSIRNAQRQLEVIDSQTHRIGLEII
jgi:hypothetical protein